MSLSGDQSAIVRSQLIVLLEARHYPKTICPSEVARAFSREDLDALGAETWRDTMDDVRRVVWQLRDSGDVEVLQKGEVLSETSTLEDVHGPIRVRSKQK